MTPGRYLILAVLALFSWWLVKITGLRFEGGRAAPPHSPDYFSTGYSKWEMDETGALKSRVTAEQMRHYQDDGTTHMNRPVMTFYNNKDETPPWIIDSESGILSADGKNLWLNGKVNIDRKKGPRNRPLTINTTNLKVQPERSYAETDAWAELLSTGQKTTGTGMKMKYADPIRIELLKKVKGKYE